MFQVLVVDDDKLARKGIISIVPWEESGLTVVGDVANGLLALEFLAEHPVDLVIVDLTMPVLSGLDFMRESQKLYPTLEFVVLSFHEEFEYVQSALRQGALDYISKIQLEQEDCSKLFHRVGEILRTKKKVKELVGTGEENADAMVLLRQNWQNLTWVYNGEQLGEMLNPLKQSVSVRQLEILLVWIAQALEDQFAVTVQAAPIYSVEEGIGWIGSTREMLVSRAVSGELDESLLSVSVLQTVAFIRSYIDKSPTTEELSARVNMSRSYFSTSFKKITGYTLNDFSQKEKAFHAASLLQKEPFSTAELAEAVGYEDSKYFAQVFARTLGVSCSDYRKQIHHKL